MSGWHILDVMDEGATGPIPIDASDPALFVHKRLGFSDEPNAGLLSIQIGIESSLESHH